MSIRELIKDCVDGEELHHLKPGLLGGEVRHAFALPRVYRFLNGASKDVPAELLKKSADARAAIDRYIAGATLAVAMKPFDKGAMAELARTDPIALGIWSFRIRDPKPQVRIFGAFAERDVFVALDFRNHDGLDFDAAVRTARGLWDSMFPDTDPVVSENVYDTISRPLRNV